MTNQNLMEWQIKLAGKKCPSYIGWCWPLMNLYLARGEKACLLGAYRTSSVSSVFGCTSNYSRRFWRSQRAQGPRCELLSAPGADCVRFSASPGRFRYLFCVSHIYRYGTLQLHIWWAKFVKGVIFDPELVWLSVPCRRISSIWGFLSFWLSFGWGRRWLLDIFSNFSLWSNIMSNYQQQWFI